MIIQPLQVHRYGAVTVFYSINNSYKFSLYSFATIIFTIIHSYFNMGVFFCTVRESDEYMIYSHEISQHDVLMMSIAHTVEVSQLVNWIISLLKGLINIEIFKINIKMSNN